VNLEHQYRMCEDVMTLSNSLIYDGHLKCGTPEVAVRSIDIPNMAALSHHHFSPSTLPRAGGKSACPSPTPGKCWIRDMLDPGVKAVFINTDTLSTKPGFPGFTSLEEAKGNRIVNPTEASIIAQLVQSLLTVGVPGTEIGVMTHYRSQLALLRHGLRGHEEVEMHTCDRFQGRDKEVVVLGLVRSNEAGSIGELLRDWRRINVAFTRAKTKLLVVGSARTLKGVGSDNPDAGQEMVAQFVQLMERKGWVYEFPRDGLESHCFAETQTQMTSTTQQDAVDLTRWKRLDRTPKKGAASKKTAAVYEEEDKENAGPKRGPKRVGINEKALLKDKPVLRDILNNYR
jgi:DNA replication ATP-dependent helicase Dna2